jgi:hypothetical protein
VSTKAMDLVQYLKAIQEVTESSFLDKEQRTNILKEMRSELPPEMMCTSSINTRQIIEKILKDKTPDGTTEAPKKKTSSVTPKGANAPQKREAEQLLQDPDVNTGGQGAAERVVKQAQKKRRSAKGSA